MELTVTIAQTQADAEQMRVVRNSCREYMTHDTAEISVARQALWWRHLDRATMLPLLFWLDGAVVGYGLVRQLHGHWWVTGGLVHEVRDRRLGRQMFERLIQHVGADDVWLEVREDNHRARRLYERMGFEVVDSSERSGASVLTMRRATVYVQPDSDGTEPAAPVALAPQLAPEIPRRVYHAPEPVEPGPTAPVRKIVAATINYDHPQRGMIAAMRERWEVSECDYLQLQRDGMTVGAIGQRLYDLAADGADVVFLQVQDTDVLEASALRRIQQDFPRVLLVHWTGDCRPFVGSYLASVCAATHLTLASSVGQLSMFRAAGASAVRYMQIGLDWEEDVLGLPEWEPKFRVPDVVFCGGYYPSQFPDGTAERVSAIRAIQAAGADIGVVGPGWPSDLPCVGTCGVKQQHHVWKRAKVALSVNHYNHIERYYSDRQLISMASGTPVVCRYVPGLEQEFDNGEHCLWFSDPEEAARLVMQLLQNAEQRARIGAAGRAHVMEHHSWSARFHDLAPALERARGKLVHGN